MDVGDDSICKRSALLVPIQILDIQHHRHVGFVTELHALIEQSVHVRFAFLLIVSKENEGYSETSNYVLTMQHNVGQFQLRSCNLHSQRVTE